MSTISNREVVRALGTTLLVLLVAALIVTSAFLILSHRIFPEIAANRTVNSAPVSIKGSQFKPLDYGDGHFEGTTSVVSALKNGEGIFEAIVDLDASHYPFLRLETRGLHTGIELVLYWRKKDSPETIHHMPLHKSRDSAYWHNLTKGGDTWNGDIEAVALGVYGDLRGNQLILEQVKLEPFSGLGAVRIIWQEWTALRGWDHTSINLLRGAPEAALLQPTVAAVLWVATALVVLAFLGPFLRIHLPTAIAMTILAAWLSLDLLWQRELVQQLLETRQEFAGKTVAEKHLRAEDEEIYRFANKIRSLLPKDQIARVFILREGSGHEFRRLKTQYYLLPHNVFNYGSHPPQDRLRAGDFVLSLDSISDLKFEREVGLLQWQGSAVPANKVHSDPIGSLYRISAIKDG